MLPINVLNDYTSWWDGMAKVKIDAKEVLDDIRAGLDNFSLMKKYKLTVKGLDSLYSKLLRVGALKRSEVDPTFKVEVRAKEVLQDIRSGISRAEFVDKHRLSEKGIQSLFTKMINSGIVSQSELDEWMAGSRRTEAGTTPSSGTETDQWLSSFDETVDLTWLEKEPKT
jgi:hypothetical protein